jgi:hypothetical protein
MLFLFGIFLIIFVHSPRMQQPIWLLHQDHVVIYYNHAGIWWACIWCCRPRTAWADCVSSNQRGRSGPTHHWISTFLTNRTQTVVIDGKSSSTVPVASGVPPGAVLDPVLFLVYINDLSDYLTHSQLRLFAHDSIIYMPIKSQHDCNKLQQDLDAAARWERDWLMAFRCVTDPDRACVL